MALMMFPVNLCATCACFHFMQGGEGQKSDKSGCLRVAERVKYVLANLIWCRFAAESRDWLKGLGKFAILIILGGQS